MIHTIQAVILDVGGVLDVPADPAVEWAARERLAAGLGMSQEEMWRLLYHSDHWKLARVGAISDAEFWHRCLAPLGIAGPAEQARFADRLFDHKEVNPAMRALLDDLRRRTRLAIISNATETLEKALAERLGVMDYFEVVINSARVGFAKPEPEIYHLALEQLGLRPEQTVFTDDQGHNVEAAARLGIHATLFTRVPALRDYLTTLGVLG